MTLKELLDKVDFDSLVPYIEKTEEKNFESIYGYREAYDILRNMKPSEDFKGEARVEWSGGEFGDEQWIGRGYSIWTMIIGRTSLPRKS